MKVQIETPNGVYLLPAEVVMWNKANYYSQQNDSEFDLDSEVEIVDSYDVIDWLINNMDWIDIEKFTVKVADASNVDSDFWCDSENFEVLE